MSIPEHKARVTYDNILRLSDDPDVNDAIKFLREREIVHFQRFGEAVELLRQMLNHWYYLIPGKFQWLLLLTASYVFYLWNGCEYLAFILFTTLTTCITGVVMGKRLDAQDRYLKEHKAELSKDDRKAYKASVKFGNRVWMIGCLALNFGVLAFCKGSLIKPLRKTGSRTDRAPCL